MSWYIVVAFLFLGLVICLQANSLTRWISAATKFESAATRWEALCHDTEARKDAWKTHATQNAAKVTELLEEIERLRQEART